MDSTDFLIGLVTQRLRQYITWSIFLLLPESWDTSKKKILPIFPHTGGREHIPNPPDPGFMHCFPRHTTNSSFYYWIASIRSSGVNKQYPEVPVLSRLV
jgi:hypothetical protein